jgi:hypothetical protein
MGVQHYVNAGVAGGQLTQHVAYAAARACARAGASRHWGHIANRH